MARKASKQQAATESSVVQTTVTRTIDLDLGDWLVATWRKLPPLPRPPGYALPADLDGCWAQTGRVQSHGWDDITLGLRWFIREAFPYVAAEEWERRRPELRERLKAESWPNDYYRRPALVFYLAALAGLH